MDTSWSYTDRDFCYFSSDEHKWILRTRKWAAEYPDEVSIEYEPEKNDGCICAKIPVRWMDGVRPPTKRNLTDEQRQTITERMKELRRKQLEERQKKTVKALDSQS